MDYLTSVPTDTDGEAAITCPEGSCGTWGCERELSGFVLKISGTKSAASPTAWRAPPPASAEELGLSSYCRIFRLVSQACHKTPSDSAEQMKFSQGSLRRRLGDQYPFPQWKLWLHRHPQPRCCRERAKTFRMKPSIRCS